MRVCALKENENISDVQGWLHKIRKLEKDKKAMLLTERVKNSCCYVKQKEKEHSKRPSNYRVAGR
jgi:hypothetical protein